MGKTVRTHLRAEDTYGYCVDCNRLVRRTSSAGCENGHPDTQVQGLGEAPAGDAVPSLPKFNWAAFIMPPVWGVGHGSWAGALVLPMWLFTDSAVQNAVFGHVDRLEAGPQFVAYAMPVFMGLVTLGLMLWYGLRGWGVAWRKRFIDEPCTEARYAEFVRVERRWMWLSVPLAAVVIALGVYFWIAILIPNGGVAPGK